MTTPEGRTVAETALTVAQMMQPHDANPAGNVHGGQIMKMIDDAAVAVAIRHARMRAVTASIDRMDFHGPVYVGNLLILKASVNYVGRTSMEVGVRVEAEDLKTGTIRHTASAYLIIVGFDENSRPAPVPPLILETEEEKRRNLAALRRLNERKKARETK